MAGSSDICLVILAIFLPPVAVLLDRGCGVDFCINILLTLLGHIPGVIHAIYLILHRREQRRDAQQSLYPPPQQQSNQQAMYGQQPMYGKGREVEQPLNHGSANTGFNTNYDGPQPPPQTQPMPPMYSAYNERDVVGSGAVRSEKHDYATPPTAQNQGYGTKEV